jgi:hypothetical protein
MFKSLYEFEKINKNNYDGIREYCLAEKVNEEYYRYSMNKNKMGDKPKGLMVKSMIIVVIIISIIVVFFSTSYSKTNTEFISIKDSVLMDMEKDWEVFTEEDVLHLPSPVKKYFNYCGYIGTPKMHSVKAVYKDVKFQFGKGKPIINIDYIQYNVANKPARIAYINSSIYGIPFEGLDSYTSGNGSMKGVLAKFFTLFNQVGVNMNKASLVTFLSECFIIPSAVLEDYITWEEIDDLHAKATISYCGETASGIFTFNENGEMISFTTNDRKAVSIDGKSEKVNWSVVLSKYEETNGIKKPTVFQAIWHYDDGDLLYFDGKDVKTEYDTNY